MVEWINSYCDECYRFIDRFGLGHKKGCSKIKAKEVVEQPDYIAELEAENAALRQQLDDRKVLESDYQQTIAALRQQVQALEKALGLAWELRGILMRAMQPFWLSAHKEEVDRLTEIEVYMAAASRNDIEKLSALEDSDE